MASSGLKHIALRTRDLKETERFYTEVLGLEVAFRAGPNMLFLRTPGNSDLLNFIKTAKDFSAQQALDHIGFKVTVTGLKRIEKKLHQHGIKIKGRRGQNAIYILDSNGYEIEYYCD